MGMWCASAAVGGAADEDNLGRFNGLEMISFNRRDSGVQAESSSSADADDAADCKNFTGAPWRECFVVLEIEDEEEGVTTNVSDWRTHAHIKGRKTRSDQIGEG